MVWPGCTARADFRRAEQCGQVNLAADMATPLRGEGKRKTLRGGKGDHKSPCGDPQGAGCENYLTAPPETLPPPSGPPLPAGPVWERLLQLGRGKAAHPTKRPATLGRTASSMDA